MVDWNCRKELFRFDSFRFRTIRKFIGSVRFGSVRKQIFPGFTTCSVRFGSVRLLIPSCPGMPVCKLFAHECRPGHPRMTHRTSERLSAAGCATPNLPTHIVPSNIAWLKTSGKFPMGLRIPPLSIRIMLESNPLKSTMLVGRLGVRSVLVDSTPQTVQMGRAHIPRSLLPFYVWV